MPPIDKSFLKGSVFLALFISVVASAVAQGSKPQWDISVGYGLALPVGDFRQAAPAKSLQPTPSGTSGQVIYYLRGIAKDGNSYATNGQFGTLDINYHLGGHWLTALSLHHSRNPVNAQPFYNYMNTIQVAKMEVISNNDYNVTAWSVGFGYEFHYKQFRLTLTPVIGQAFISSPDYVFEWYTYPFFFDVTKLSNSVLLGLHGNIGYKVGLRFYTSIKFDFDSANFDYTVKMHSPGTTPLLIDDRITYRVFKLGLTFGIRFARPY